MARQISELQSLPFYQIIGAPLLALVQGQAQAAQTTAEFIERVGFVPSPTDSPDALGTLRMMSFRYQKTGPDGNLQAYNVEMPMLSLLPIPAMEVKSAEFDFSLKITDVQSTETNTAMSSPDAQAGDWLAAGRTEFRGAMGKMQTSTSDNQTMDFQMQVKIKVGPPDTTAGLAYLYRLFDQAINSQAVVETTAQAPAGV